MTAENIIALAAMIVSLLSMGVSFWQARMASIQASSAEENEAAAKRHAAAAERHAEAASEQTALMRQQLAESRLNFRERFGNLADEVSKILEGNVGASHISIQGGDMIMITVSEQPDEYFREDLKEKLEGVVKKYGYENFRIEIEPDLTN